MKDPTLWVGDVMFASILSANVSKKLLNKVSSSWNRQGLKVKHTGLAEAPSSSDLM